MTSFLLLLLIFRRRTSRSTSMWQVCHSTAYKHVSCCFWAGFSVLLFRQAPCSCSCRTPRGSTPAGSSAGAETPPHPTARGRLVAKSGSDTTGPTTPCWPRPGGQACWGMRGLQTACSETSPTSVPTRTTDCSTSGTAARRKWTPALPDNG